MNNYIVNKGNMPFIYLFTFPNDKQYVGQTIEKRVQSRWKNHKSTSNNSNDKGYDALLYRAIRKHGWVNVKKEVLIECPIEELDTYEMKYINEYNTLAPNGYNSVTGGNRNRVACQATKEKMRVKALKRFSNPDAIKVISKAAKKRFTDPTEVIAHSKRMRARPSKSLRKREDTKDFPKYLRIVQRSNNVSYVVRDHPCSYGRSKSFSAAKYGKLHAYKQAFKYLLILDLLMITNKLNQLIESQKNIHTELTKLINIIQEQGSETKR